MAMTATLRRIANALPMAVAASAVLAVQARGIDLTAFALGAFAGLGQWIVMPLLGRKPGWIGLAGDAGACLFGLIVSGAIAGTLLAAPGWGTILGVRAALALPFGSAFALFATLAAIVATIFLARR